jgi:hypothetical protein
MRGSLPSYETKRNGGGWNFEWRHGAAKDKVTTVSSRAIDPKTARKIRKALGLD